MLEIVAKQHDQWVRMAISAGSPPNLAEDILQEVYLRLHKYRKTAEPKLIKEDGTVNVFYMWGAVRNTVRTELGKEKVYISLHDFFAESEPVMPDYEFEQRYADLMQGIKSEVDGWGPYNSKLFNLYFKTDLSMRKIAGGTGIGLTHIFTSINKYKSEIKEKFSEDFHNLIDTDERY
jgi:DNA-directed RNA polymerase specialized sigma24 family protein